MDYTGERFIPGISGTIALEHLHRYLLACQLSAQKAILDIASGEGYGSAMLARNASKVIGVDISEQAIAHARKLYKTENLEFLVGSCQSIPAEDKSVDLVISFETLEHHAEHDQMMLEIKRVLKPGGVLFISSPDKQVYSVEADYQNPFHVKELYKQEFAELLERHFTNTLLFGQKVECGSAIFAEHGQQEVLSYHQDEDGILCTAGVYKPVYWLGLASDLELPKLKTGLYGMPLSRKTHKAQPLHTLVQLFWADQPGRFKEQNSHSRPLLASELRSEVVRWPITESIAAAPRIRIDPGSHSGRYIFSITVLATGADETEIRIPIDWNQIQVAGTATPTETPGTIFAYGNDPQLKWTLPKLNPVLRLTHIEFCVAWFPSED